MNLESRPFDESKSRGEQVKLDAKVKHHFVSIGAFPHVSLPPDVGFNLMILLLVL
jgi:hypothetical protein